MAAANRLGFPRGYKFAPKELELVRIVDQRILGRPLPSPLRDIFHDLRVLSFHPIELYEDYRAFEEDGFIYFISEREYATGKMKRPVRVTDYGTWKASGGGKTIKHGDVKVGKQLTLVFYQRRFQGDRNPFKTTWGMHEFTKITGPHDEVSRLAVYRLYRVKNNEDTTEGFLHGQAPAPAVVNEPPPPPPSLAPPALTANVASTSQALAQSGHHYGNSSAFMAGPPVTSWVGSPSMAMATPPTPAAAASNKVPQYQYDGDEFIGVWDNEEAFAKFVKSDAFPPPAVMEDVIRSFMSGAMEMLAPPTVIGGGGGKPAGADGGGGSGPSSRA